MFYADINYDDCYYYSRPQLNSPKAYDKPQGFIIEKKLLHHAFSMCKLCFFNAGLQQALLSKQG
jgi:hypothetical protein